MSDCFQPALFQNGFEAAYKTHHGVKIKRARLDESTFSARGYRLSAKGQIGQTFGLSAHTVSVSTISSCCRVTKADTENSPVDQHMR